MTEGEFTPEQETFSPLRSSIDYEILPSDQREELDVLSSFRDNLLTASNDRRKQLTPYEKNTYFWNKLFFKRQRVLNELGGETALDQQKIGEAETIALAWTEEVYNLENLTYSDYLTGAVNRRRLDEIGNYLIKRKQEHTPQKGIDACVFIDGDKFKSINDKHGHPIGDRVLKKIVERLKQLVREGDVVGRYGGEEFTLLLPNIKPARIEAQIDPSTGKEISEARTMSPQEVLAARLEDIREAIAATVAPDIEVDDLSLITASMGATFLQEGDTELQQVYERADQNLYQAKNDNKNCVYIDGKRITPQPKTDTVGS